MSCWARRSGLQRDLAAGCDLRVDAEVLVGPGAQERGRDRHIARARVRIDVGGLAPLRAGEHREPRRPDADLLVEPVQLSPRRQPVEIDVGAEAQRVDLAPDRALQLAHARQVDDVHAPGRHVREAVARRLDDLGRPAQLRLHVGGDELLDQLPPQRRVEPAPHHRLAAARDGERAGGVVEAAPQRGQALVAHQHEEVDLGQVARGIRIEPAGTVLDCVSPVERQGLARPQFYRCNGSGVNPLTG